MLLVIVGRQVDDDLAMVVTLGDRVDKVDPGITELICGDASENVGCHMTQRFAALRQRSERTLVIAQHDLEIRGPGEMLGTRQTGNAEFKVADLQRDKGLLDDVQKAAALLYRHHPECVSPLLSRWLPNHDQYLNV